MSIIKINFGPSGTAKLQTLGLKIASARGENVFQGG